jgi:hypothetical protein
VLLRSQSPSLEQAGEEVTRGGRLGPVVLEFGRAAARDLITFVEAAPAEEHQGAAVFQLGGRLDGTEGELGPSGFCGSRRRPGRRDEDRRDPTDRPDNPPATDQLGFCRAARITITSSWGARTRL